MRLACFYCDRPFEVSPQSLGSEVVCPHCRQKMRLPSSVAATAAVEEPGEGLRGWLRSCLSGFLSFLFHFTALVVFSLVTCDYRGAGGLGEEVMIGQLASEHLSDIQKDQLDAGAVEKTVKTEQSQLDETLQEVAPPNPAVDGDAVEIQAFQLAPSGAAGGAPEVGAIAGGGGALGEGASFMGVRGKGRRFVIIADRSGSMSDRAGGLGGPKVEYVKQEILEALSTMKPGTRFQLILFNQGALPYPKPGWRDPAKDKADVEQWLRPIVGEGGTYPTPAFEIAFGLQPRPDVIFFMTDGLFDARVVDQVAAMNRREERRVVIHTIAFVERSAEPLLRQIAKDSGGTYRYVSGL